MVSDNDTENRPNEEQPGVKQRWFNATVDGGLKAGQREQEGILPLIENNWL